MLPQWKPAIAEGFGLSLLTATVVVMTFQVKDFGEPINKGFLTVFMSSGGYRQSYIWTKYIKAVLVNLMMSGVFLALLYSKKFDDHGINTFILMWCFINPLYVIQVTSYFVIKNRSNYMYAVKFILWTSSIMAVLILFSAGNQVYTEGFSHD